MGKSALALNFAAQVAKRNEGAVAIFSLEMPSDSMMKRLMSSESQVYSDKLRSGKLTNEEMSRLYEAGSHLSERKIYIDDTSSIKVSQIFSKCRKLKSENGSISLVVIDYLQLITGTRADSRQQEVSDISRNLKILAKEMECPVIALSQLSRKVEERTDHEPQLSDLRESGSIEQDADIVLFDPDAQHTISAATQHGNTDFTLFEGYSVTGKIRKVMLRGEWLVDEGQWLGKPGGGRFVARGESGGW